MNESSIEMKLLLMSIVNMYLNSVESCWRLFEYPISDRSHILVYLPVHLENRQIIAYHEEEDIVNIQA